MSKNQEKSSLRWFLNFDGWHAIVLAVAVAGVTAALFLYRNTADLRAYDLAMQTQVRTMPASIETLVLTPEVYATLDSTAAFNTLLKKILRKLQAASPRAVFIEDDFTVEGQDDPELVAQFRALPPVVNVGPGTVDGKADVPLPLPRIREAGVKIGHSQLLTSAADAGVRAFPWTLTDARGQLIESVQAAIARASGLTPRFTPRYTDEAGMAGTPKVPAGALYWFPHFQFRPEAQPMDVRSFLSDETPLARFHDKTVLVMLQPVGGQHVFYPPLGSSIADLAMLDAIAAVASGVSYAWLPAGGVAALCALLALSAGLLFRRVGDGLAHALLLVSVSALLAAAMALLHWQHLWLPVWAPTGVLLAVWIARLVWNAWQHRRQLTQQMSILSAMLDERPTGGPLATAPAQAGPATRDAALLIAATIERLGAERRLLSELTSNLPVGVIGLDAESCVVMSNQLAARLLSTGTAHELIGKRSADLSNWMLPIGGERANLLLPHAAESLEVTTPERRAVRILSRQLHRSSAMAAVVVLDDVTDERLAIRERDEALDFLSHDLRSPLSSLVAAISNRKALSDSPAEREFLEDMHRLAGTSMALCNQFLEIARSDARPALAFEPIDLADLAAEVCAEFEPICAAAGVTLQRQLSFADTQGDVAMLARLLRNLLENAVRHGPKGSEIDVSVTEESAGSVVRIRDRGPGFDSARPLRESTHEPATRPQQRFGLGLAFVRKACALHDAVIQLDNAEPGACVTLIFKAA